jgi:hypothetical protein
MASNFKVKFSISAATETSFDFRLTQQYCEIKCFIFQQLHFPSFSLLAFALNTSPLSSRFCELFEKFAREILVFDESLLAKMDFFSSATLQKWKKI